MSKTAQKIDPKLWDNVKAEITRVDKGGHAGQWSARRRNLPCRNIKRGGGYIGNMLKAELENAIRLAKH